MKITLNSFSHFYQNIWQDRRDSFSYEAWQAIYDYIVDIEEQTGEETEFDPIAICCEWSEYESAEAAAAEHFTFEGMTYDADGNELDTAEEVEQKALEYLEENTTVLQLDGGGVVIVDF